MNSKLMQQLKTAFAYSDDKLEVFIDGSNLAATTKALNMSIDFQALTELLSSYGRLIRISYYTAMLDNDDHNPLVPLTDWLAYNGYNMVMKKAKQFKQDDGSVVTKGNVDVDLAVDAMKAANLVDHVILFTGDGDFVALVKALQESRVKVTAISSITTKPSMIADELRKQVDNFIDLSDLREILGKKGKG